MLAKAAANASIPGIKGAVYLDSHDVKIIQYKAALYKLVEMARLLTVLQKNLDKPSGSNIVPLINYILILFEGPMFNVHPVLRKRFQLLCNFKNCKVAQINPALNTGDIELLFELTPVDYNNDTLRKNMYNNELQCRMLGCLRSLVNNATSLYERKLRQIQIERNARRPTDSLGRPIPFEVNSIEDILRPRESSLCLDLAVLINNREEDTSNASMRKLQTQVLNKFLVSFNNKMWPVMKNYNSQLKRFVTIKTNSPTSLKELQHWEYSIHRIYALLLRSLYILGMGVSLARQIYYPNHLYLNAVRTKLLSENVFAYEGILQKVEIICQSLEDQETVKLTELLSTLDHYSKQGTIHHVQQKNIIDLYQNCVSKVIPHISNVFSTLETFCTMWKFIESNGVANKSFDNKTEDQLTNMFTERLAVDKLTHIEQAMQKSRRVQGQTSPSPSTSSNSSRGSLKRSVILKATNPSSGSVACSMTSSPGKISPLMARSDSFEKNVTNFTIYGSPQVSRKGSISENRNYNYAGTLPKTITEQKNFPKSPLSNAKKIGRPRSSSLQSPLDDKGKLGPLSSLQSRSNSLQAGAAINQKIVQNTINDPDSYGKKFTLLTENERRNVKSSSHLQSRMKSSLKAVTAKDVPVKDVPVKDVHKSRSDLDGKTNIPMEIASLSINGNKNDAIEEMENQKLDTCGEEEDSTEPTEEASCPKKVRFSGVPPMSLDEKRSPTKKGWYKKPAVLHYPPPPPAIASQKYRLRQEGMAFKTSLRDTGNNSKKTSTIMNFDIPASKETTTQRLTSKLRDKLR